MSENVKDLINEITTQTIVKLKKSKLIKDSYSDINCVITVDSPFVQ